MAAFRGQNVDFGIVLCFFVSSSIQVICWAYMEVFPMLLPFWMAMYAVISDSLQPFFPRYVVTE
jgi:hypothetical protein